MTKSHQQSYPVLEKFERVTSLKDHQIEKIFRGIESISPLNASDATLFRSKFDADRICYANSWLYILRATRSINGELGYKYIQDDVVFGIGYRNGITYLVRPIGDRILEVVLDVCAQISSLTNTCVVLKKVDQELTEKLKEISRFQIGYLVKDTSILEDEAFPENVILLNKLFTADFNIVPEANSFVRRVKGFEKKPQKLIPLFNEAAIQVDISNILNAVRNIAQGNDNKLTAYSQIITEVFNLNKNSKKYRSCLFVDENTIHGIYIGELLNTDTMGLYCALSSKATPGITEWMDFSFLRNILKEGISKILLGGSETLGVHMYIKKLLPVTPEYSMFPLIYHK